MHYYQFNIGDYKSHTNHLDLLEDLAFRRMIDWCYLHEKPLSLDINEIAKKISMRTHTDSIAYVLFEYFKKTDIGYVNSRINKEVEAFKAKSDKARKSAEVRWSKKRPQSDSNANALKTQSDSNAKHKPLNNNHKPLNNNKDNSEFDLVWSMYEKKGNRKTSLARFNKLKDSEKKLMSVHLPRYVKSTPDKQFRKSLESYINLECWNDEINEASNNGQNDQARFETTSDRYERQSKELQEREASARRNKQNSTSIQTDG